MNNEQVIAYVAQHSKNPHAAMIVEWLLTGWGIEFKASDGSWEVSLYPRWRPGTEYRLVKPKMKPAYRVFRLVGETRPRVQYRNADGSESSTLLTNTTAVYLTDWIEYDPNPKKWPTPLVERIAAIDIEAAEWIVENWDELLDDKYTYNGYFSRESNQLRMMFSWVDTPQDGLYWLEIHKKLGE